MINTKTITNSIIWFCVLMAAFTLYFSAKVKMEAKNPTFVYEEISAQKASAVVQPGLKIIPNIITQQKIIQMPIMPPAVISQVLPEYPISALEKGIEGVAYIQAAIGLNGGVEKVEVKNSSGNATLDDAALNAISHWRFSPASQNGSALSSWFEIPVRFQIK
ncbi:MAG: TonB family protein [Candidatus Saganbacteria bacterium]|uniref:TonB family protein n=1 Tax=Candidatus Saganbacteria bacterium TaxID=2575572 RepID=A0A833P0E0_UNCSA|nr:MAG: TonB family protein [Candidatus Saganbacteria bacterium]